MYYIKIVLLNIFRQKKYSFPVFAAMCIISLAITVVFGIHSNSELEIEKISESYVTTVKTVFYPLTSQTGNAQQLSDRALMTEDAEMWADAEEVAMVSYTQPASFSFYVWQLIYNSDNFSDDVVITDGELMNMVYSQNVLNSEMCYSITLVDGEYIPNEKNSDNSIPILISDYLAEKTGLKASDRITISRDAYFPMPSDSFVINGIFKSKLSGDKNLIYIPCYVSREFNETNGIAVESSHLDYVFNVVFTLKTPDAAEAFIEKAHTYFQEKGYILQADDYEYKKAVYPLEMMIRMNAIIGGSIVFIGFAVMLILIYQSMRLKAYELTVFRLLSIPKNILFGMYAAEKCILLVPSALIGVTVGIITLSAVMRVYSFGFMLYSIAAVFLLFLLLMLFSVALYLGTAGKSLMGEMGNGK